MNNFETDVLRHIELAPYLQVATALIGKARKIGGNQFRHTWATVGILIDHKIIEGTILKAGALHDLKEDAPNQYNPEQIKRIDVDGAKVVELVEELSIRIGEPKSEYLIRVMTTGSREAKLIKLADRISNLTDIQLGTFDIHKVQKTLDETIRYILPYAKEINENMFLEMSDLICTRTKYVQKTIELITNTIIGKMVENIKNIDTDAIQMVRDKIDATINNLHTIFSLSEEDRCKYFDEYSEKIEKDIHEFNILIHNSFNKIMADLSSEFVLHNLYSQIYANK